MTVEVEDSTENHWVATCGDVVVVVAYEGSYEDPSHVAAISRAFLRLYERSGRPVNLLFILPLGHGKPPSTEVRDALTAAIRRLEPKASRAAIVVVGSGFGSAIQRSVITGALTIVRGRKPYKVTSSVREGLEYLIGAKAKELLELELACERHLAPARG